MLPLTINTQAELQELARHIAAEIRRDFHLPQPELQPQPTPAAPGSFAARKAAMLADRSRKDQKLRNTK